MQNFYRLAQGLPIVPLMAAIHAQKELWDTNPLRTTHPASPHTQAHDILLRFNEITKGEEAKVIDEHESVNYPAWYKLPQAQAMVFDLMRTVNGLRLGRVMITKLVPGAVIAPHVDGGSHAAYYERFHITLQNNPGSVFKCGDETVHMAAGEVWWFDNQVEHSVVNNSGDDRLTMIVDIQVAK